VTKNQQQLVAAKEGNIKLMRQQMEALRAAQKKMTQEEDRYVIETLCGSLIMSLRCFLSFLSFFSFLFFF
jgi:hypothetical protein